MTFRRGAFRSREAAGSKGFDPPCKRAAYLEEAMQIDRDFGISYTTLSTLKMSAGPVREWSGKRDG